MDLDVLFWLVLAAIVLVVVSQAFDEPARAMSGMWRYREVLWPTGVQEDDDAHWSWVRSPRARPAEPEIVDEGLAELPDVGQVYYEVRSAADRPRS